MAVQDAKYSRWKEGLGWKGGSIFDISFNKVCGGPDGAKIKCGISKGQFV